MGCETHCNKRVVTRRWITFILLLCVWGVAPARTLYVRAGAAADGVGSRAAPFNSLAQVEAYSSPGDTIVVLPVPLSVPPLNGGIALKPDQRLIGDGSRLDWLRPHTKEARITNTSDATNHGDGVILADGDTVSNLAISDTYRGGIYGNNVAGVTVQGNSLSGINSSCTIGFLIYFPKNLPLLNNGWAAIMIDESGGQTWVSIKSNYIHDGKCSDGIDVRATKAAVLSARIDGNTITRLAQGSKVSSVLAIGLQTRDQAMLSVESTRNSETYIGSAGADCEGLFTNQTGGSLTWEIDQNQFSHGVGGESCNGAEFYNATGHASENVYISDSSFSYNPGDMIQFDNGGDTGSSMHLTLRNVSVTHTSFPRDLPPESKFTNTQYMDNLGRCMDQYSWGHRNVNSVIIIDSKFSDCYGDGIGSDVSGGVFSIAHIPQDRPKLRVMGGLPLGDGEGDTLIMKVYGSSIDGAGQYGFHFANSVHMARLRIQIRNTRFAGSRGAAVVAIDQDGTTKDTDIDLGGRAGNRSGGNCILGGGSLLAEVTGYHVYAVGNWWGKAGGPNAGSVSVTSGELHVLPALDVAPVSCSER